MAGAWADAAPAKSAKAATPRTRALILSSVVSGRFASPDIQRTLKVIVRPSRPCALANLVNFAAPWRGRFSFGRPERPKQASNSSTVQDDGKRGYGSTRNGPRSSTESKSPPLVAPSIPELVAILCLFSSCGPSAIRWFVITIVINPVECMGRGRLRTYVGIKRRE